MIRRRHSAPRQRRAVWQVIYMDLMTIMMVYFVILWTAETSSARVESEGISATIGDQSARMVNLPGDVMFASGKSELSPEGVRTLERLFKDAPAEVLDFEQGGVANRRLVIHGHTDEIGDKEENFALGHSRARSVYTEIRKYSQELADHVVICTHADNTPATTVPLIAGEVSAQQRQELRDSRARNRRITIEDQLIDTSR